MTDCIFCQIGDEKAPATFVRRWRDVFAIEPIGPVTVGHILVIPRVHVADFAEDSYISGYTMMRAAELVREMDLGPCNIITSRGKEATQSVFHLHLHIVPRAENDGLALPWYSGRRKRVEVSR